MKIKKSLTAILSTAMLFSLLAGCSSGTSTTSEATTSSEASASVSSDAGAETSAIEQSSAGTALTIGASIADQKNPFYIDIVEGMESALKDGDQLVTMDANFDPARQISDVEDLLQQGVDIILLDPVDGKGIQAALEACKAKNVPVISFNSAVDDADMVVSNVATDNYMAGELIGKALGEALNGEGEIGMYTYSVVAVTNDRALGFKDAIAEFPGIEIVVEQDGTPGVDTALPVMESFLQSYPNLKGMFALNDPSAIGCVAAIESAGKLGDILVVGVDGSADGIANIKDGKMYASAAQDPQKIGSTSIEVAYEVLQGETVEKDIKIPSFLIDQSNVDQYS